MPLLLYWLQIPEEFTYGLSLELTTARAADKVRVRPPAKVCAGSGMRRVFWAHFLGPGGFVPGSAR